MANKKHFLKLKEGVGAWNQWRKENPGLEPDLQSVNLSDAQLQGAHLSRANLEETTLDGITLVDNYHVGPQVADIRWGETNLAVVDWSQLKILGDEYKVHRPTTSSMAMKSKATDLEDYRTAVRANRQLAVVLRDQGLNEDADRFAYRAQVLQWRVFWEQKKFGRWLFSGFLALVAGYGYRMERILFTYAIVVSLFAVAYFILGMYYPPPIPWSQAFLESITAFHGRVFSELFLLNTPQIWVTAGEAIAGLVVEGVFIAMLTQRFFGR